MAAFANDTLPDGWLACDGTAVSRITYANLFSKIGTTYGTGDSSTTFNLPNLTDRFIQGNNTAGTVKNAGLPDISGRILPSIISGAGAVANVGSGAFNTGGQTTVIKIGGNISNISYFSLDFAASRSSSIYGNSTTVQPPALTMRFAIFAGHNALHRWIRTA